MYLHVYTLYMYIIPKCTYQLSFIYSYMYIVQLKPFLSVSLMCGINSRVSTNIHV